MGVFSRLGTIFSAEANALVDKLEDPVKVIEQSIRDLEKGLAEEITGLMQIKASAFQARKEYESTLRQAQQFANHAEKLSADPTKQELVKRTLKEAQRLSAALPVLKEAMEKQEASVRVSESSAEKTKTDIADWKRKLTTFRARANAAAINKKNSMRHAQTDTSGILATMERMEQKVTTDELEAEAYRQIAETAQAPKSLEEELRQALPPPSETPSGNMADEIAALKAQLNS